MIKYQEIGSGTRARTHSAGGTTAGRHSSSVPLQLINAHNVFCSRARGRSRSRRWSPPHARHMLPAPRLNTGRRSTRLWTRRRGCIDNPAHESRPKRTRARLSPR
eukprot:scaffold23370_cov120-Isochrysis_galbana.AAC.4